MFNFIGRNLTFSVFKTTSVHRLFLRSLCSSPAASDNSFTVSNYLIDSFGFPPEKAISATRYLKFKTPDRPDSVIAFFKHQGFTKTQISLLVRKFPKALTCHPEKNLLPKFDFLSSTGLSDSDIVKLITASPTFLGRSLKNHIEPTFNSLRDLLQSNDRALVAIKMYPWLLIRISPSNMPPNIQLLRDVGVPASKMFDLLTYHPRDFVITTQQFKEIVEEVLKMSINPLKITFMLAIHVLRSISKSTWKKKMEAYKKWGWSEAQILQAFRTSPWCMMKSVDKIDNVMDFLVNTMGYDASIIAKSSIIISYSLEKRIIPRCLVYRYCLDNGLMNDKNYCGFCWWLQCSEKSFIERLKKFEKEATGVVKFYQEKLDLVK